MISTALLSTDQLFADVYEVETLSAPFTTPSNYPLPMDSIPITRAQFDDMRTSASVSIFSSISTPTATWRTLSTMTSQQMESAYSSIDIIAFIGSYGYTEFVWSNITVGFVCMYVCLCLPSCFRAGQ